VTPFSLLWWYTQRDDIRFVARNEKWLTSKTRKDQRKEQMFK